MCGISGIINFKEKIDNFKIQKIHSAIKHRGPDDEKIIDLKFCKLGMLRLSIIDLTEASNQPFIDEERKVTLIYNGEIYNFKELREEYFPNKKFKSTGDGEILLYMYIKFGITFLKKIKGMFAICIVDEKFDKIYLIRDRFGIKPLYYYHDNRGFLNFCSEIKGLVQLKEIKKEINFEEIYLYLNKGFINSTNQTWFKNINQIPPGSYLVMDRKNIETKSYYKLEDNIDEDKDNSKISFKETLKEIKDKIYNSFSQHKNFDVKGGLHVSGGTDSAIISALANIFNLNKNLKTYTFTFENKIFSELEDAKKISESCNLDSENAMLKDQEVENFMFDVLRAEYEPFSSLRILSQHHLYKKFKDEIRVVIDGSGGDEIGAGYIYHVLPWYLDMLKDNKITKEKLRFYKLSEFVKNNTISLQHFITGSLNQTFSPGSSTVDGSVYSGNNLISRDFNRKLSENVTFEINRPFKSFLRNAQYADLYHLKLPRALRYVDRASMSNSIESRVPLLDHELVEACFQAPSRHKIVNNQQRSLFKYNFKNEVNNNVLFKNKRTIADPQSYWLKNNLKNLSKDVFYSESFDEFGLLDKKKFRKYYESFLSYPKHFNTFFIFQVLIMELWVKNIFKS